MVRLLLMCFISSYVLPEIFSSILEAIVVMLKYSALLSLPAPVSYGYEITRSNVYCFVIIGTKCNLVDFLREYIVCLSPELCCVFKIILLFCRNVL